MFEHINNLRWIGDLSLEDADVLAKYARQSKHILEFGCGGSTQIIAQCDPETAISIETDTRWIAVTQQRLNKLNKTVQFSDYKTNFDQQFDLIFVDGVDHLRREFAIETWQYLSVGGTMLFHDTRRFADFQNAAWVAQLYFNEIDNIEVNSRASNNQSSNITAIHKKQYEPYVNWNYTENKPLWAYGTLDGKQELWTKN